jgi:serine/threonine-protein kinase|nr:serine/threonine-protein kinase [Kofleriaceae bacterium]
MDSTDETIEDDGPIARTTRPHARPRFELGDELGRGGMGEVLLAHDTQIGRDVAIKRMITRDPNARQLARFMREAKIQGRLDHPAIVPVYELGLDRDGLPFFAMKRLAGRTLAQLLEARAAPRTRLLRAFVDVCLAVEFAHVRGVVHRDLKPANVMLGDFGEVYVLDWGVAKIAEDTDELADVIEGDGLATRAGATVGTTGYMPPEQADDAAAVDARADVYALGRVLAVLLSRFDDAPPELVQLVVAATRPDRDDRTSTARELADAVQRYLDGDRDVALRRDIARGELAAARAATSQPDAIRSAGRAIALDPTLAEAAQLVASLVTAPPVEMPPEVEAEIATDDHEAARAQTVAALRAYALAVAAIVPALALTRAFVDAALVAAFGAAMMLYLRDNMRRAVPTARWWSMAAWHAGAIALATHVFSAMIVAPTIAAIVAVVFSAGSVVDARRQRVALGALLVGALVVPAVAEQIGWIGQRLFVDADGNLTVIGPLDVKPWMLAPLVAIYAVASVTAALVVGSASRRQVSAMRRRVMVQAWRLRQLAA